MTLIFVTNDFTITHIQQYYTAFSKNFLGARHFFEPTIKSQKYRTEKLRVCRWEWKSNKIMTFKALHVLKLFLAKQKGWVGKSLTLILIQFLNTKIDSAHDSWISKALKRVFVKYTSKLFYHHPSSLSKFVLFQQM